MNRSILVSMCAAGVVLVSASAAMASCFLHQPDNKTLELYADGGNVKVISLRSTN